MKNKIKFKFKNMFSSLLVSYIVILFIPFVLAAFMYGKAYDMTRTSCIEVGSSALFRGKELFEQKIESLDHFALQFVYDMELKQILRLEEPEAGDADIYKIMKYREKFIDRISDTEDRTYYSLILKNGFVFTTSYISFDMEKYYEYRHNYQEMKFENWKSMVFSADGRKLLPMKQMNRDGIPLRAITYTYPIVINVSGIRRTESVIQTLIPEETMRTMFSLLLDIKGSSLYLLDMEGNSLAEIYGESNDENSIPDYTLMAEESGSFESTAGRRKEIVVYRKSPYAGFIYAATIPESRLMNETREVRHMALLASFLCLCTGGLLGIWFAWKYSIPIRNLIHNINLLVRPPQEKNDPNLGEEPQYQDGGISEYEYLEYSIVHLIENHKTMELALKEKKMNERALFLNRLLEGRFEQEEDWTKEGEQAGIFLNRFGYCMVSMELGLDSELMIQIWGQQVIPELLAVHICDRRYLSVLFGFYEEGGEAALAEQIGEVNHLIEDQCGRKVKTGIGRTYQEKADIAFSYTQSCYSASVNSESRKDGIVSYRDISPDMNAFYYSHELEEKLINSTKHADQSQIQAVFKTLYQENAEKRNLSPTMEQMLSSNIMATLMKLYGDVVPEEEVNQIAAKINHCKDLATVLGLLEEYFFKISRNHSYSRGERDEAYRRQMMEYVKEHYGDVQLGVAMAAEYFSLSENYFSQVFKAVVGDSFSSYLEKERIGRAKEWIEEGGRTVEEIAAMTGYSNSATFRRAFKRLTGISPVAWKQQNDENAR